MIYVTPEATPVTVPFTTVATAVSSEVIVHSEESMLILLYKPPLIPITEIFIVSLAASSITAGVTAISEIVIADAAEGISVIYAYTEPSEHDAPSTASASPSNFVVVLPLASSEMSNVPDNWNEGTSICILILL